MPLSESTTKQQASKDEKGNSAGGSRRGSRLRSSKGKQQLETSNGSAGNAADPVLAPKLPFTKRSVLGSASMFSPLKKRTSSKLDAVNLSLSGSLHSIGTDTNEEMDSSMRESSMRDSSMRNSSIRSNSAAAQTESMFSLPNWENPLHSPVSSEASVQKALDPRALYSRPTTPSFSYDEGPPTLASSSFENHGNRASMLKEINVTPIYVPGEIAPPSSVVNPRGRYESTRSSRKPSHLGGNSKNPDPSTTDDVSMHSYHSHDLSQSEAERIQEEEMIKLAMENSLKDIGYDGSTHGMPTKEAPNSSACWNSSSKQPLDMPSTSTHSVGERRKSKSKAKDEGRKSATEIRLCGNEMRDRWAPRKDRRASHDDVRLNSEDHLQNSSSSIGVEEVFMAPPREKDTKSVSSRNTASTASIGSTGSTANSQRRKAPPLLMDVVEHEDDDVEYELWRTPQCGQKPRHHQRTRSAAAVVGGGAGGGPRGRSVGSGGGGGGSRSSTVRSNSGYIPPATPKSGYTPPAGVPTAVTPAAPCRGSNVAMLRNQFSSCSDTSPDIYTAGSRSGGGGDLGRKDFRVNVLRSQSNMSSVSSMSEPSSSSLSSNGSMGIARMSLARHTPQELARLEQRMLEEALQRSVNDMAFTASG